MGTLSIGDMRSYLSRSLSSLNQNKINGVLAEVDFRRQLELWGYSGQISVGGWLFRTSNRENNFGQRVIALFPKPICPDVDHAPEVIPAAPPLGLHTICATFHQLGMHSYFCDPVVATDGDPCSVQWRFVQLGIPVERQHETFPFQFDLFKPRTRRHNFLRYTTDTTGLSDQIVPEEFAKENLRVSFCSQYLSETSDVDGIFWGQRYTYPLEIKEKTVATNDSKVGPYFGLDVGPFVKLSYYAAKKTNMKSLFIVREIDNENTRNLRQWWYITFDELAQYASWVFGGGGTNMQGGRSAVVKIPQHAFHRLDENSIANL